MTITVTADDDTLVDPGETATITHVLDPSSDDGYDMAVPAITIPDVTASITDDDVAGIDVDPLDGISVAELTETTDTYEVKLTAQPSSDVVIDLTFDSSQVYQPTPQPLTFTTTDWNVAQTVTVQAKQDAIIEAIAPRDSGRLRNHEPRHGIRPARADAHRRVDRRRRRSCDHHHRSRRHDDGRGRRTRLGTFLHGHARHPADNSRDGHGEPRQPGGIHCAADRRR